MKNNKIEKYHFEEIVLILLILSSELSKYDDDDLKCFSESIEGRIEILFTKDFLTSLNKEYGIKDKTASELEELKNLVIKLYGSHWLKKLLVSNQEINTIKQSACKILDALKIRNIEIKKFSEEHLKIDW